MSEKPMTESEAVREALTPEQIKMLRNLPTALGREAATPDHPEAPEGEGPQESVSGWVIGDEVGGGVKIETQHECEVAAAAFASGVQTQSDFEKVAKYAASLTPEPPVEDAVKVAAGLELASSVSCGFIEAYDARDAQTGERTGKWFARDYADSAPSNMRSVRGEGPTLLAALIDLGEKLSALQAQPEGGE